ncbi:methyl-accepting chemotaxis protein [Thiomicrorhabdus sp. zzn3]|uniref:methyl-accepting chemotaxis protein n=1 Tax=Thiomicrorhabdus sp. zzn3 TaxID=3039775 RepID=UPI0024371DD5|nr:methyl-accepting chemotaxis protein [Thiomicrorhabdus sp. zzn3]MDG6777092.1 methyl-accepting chemotaxis protein [Thiomicrorhabdus sp. zzn3]
MLKNLKIGQQLGLGFGLVVLLLVLFAINSFMTFQKAADDFSHYRGFALDSLNAGRVQANILIANDAANKYVQTRDKKYRDEYEKRLATIEEIALEQNQNLQNPERKAMSDQILASLAEYKTLASDSFELMAKRDDLLHNTMNVNGPKMRSQVSRLIEIAENSANLNLSTLAANTQEHLLLGRIYALKFMDTNSADDAKRAKQEFNITSQQLELMQSSALGDEASRLTTQASALLQGYINAFDQMVQTIETRNVKFKEGFIPLGEKVANLSEEIKLSVKKDQDTLGPQIQANNESAINVIIAISTIAVIFGVIIALVITRVIARPVNQMAQIMAKVEQSGDFGQRVDAEGRSEVAMAGQALNGLLESLQQAIQEANATMARMAQGDCSQPMQGEYNGDLLRLKDGINQSQSQVNEAMNALQAALTSLSEADFSHQVQINDDVQGTYRRLLEQSASTMHSLNAAIQEIQSVMDGMSSGEFNHRVNAQMPGDLNELKNNVNQSLDKLEAAINEVSAIMAAQGEGDLTGRVNGQYQGQLKQLADSLNSGMEKTAQAVARVMEAARSVQEGSQQIEQGTNDLSERTQNQAASLEETAASMEEMASAIRQTTDNAQHANQLSTNARTAAEQGSKVMDQTITSMENISEASAKISDIVTIIDGIAFQTNLLALNAAVEAARAGEHGRGFAVVAGEVRTLAQKSAESAKDIKNLIENTSEQIKGGSELVAQSGESLKEINQAILQVSDIVSEISVAADEQSQGISQVNQAIGNIDSATQQNAALVEETAAASTSLEEQASSLMEIVSQFKIPGGLTAEPTRHIPAPAKPVQAAVTSKTAETKATTPSPPEKKPVEQTPPPPKPVANNPDEWEEF